MPMHKSEKDVDDRYLAEGWLPLSKGWPDRAYLRLKDGKLEARFVEIKSPSDRVRLEQELMHMVLRSLGLDVQVEPASKRPRKPVIPLETLMKMLGALKLKKSRTDVVQPETSAPEKM
jgi:hypothetical protein